MIRSFVFVVPAVLVLCLSTSLAASTFSASKTRATCNIDDAYKVYDPTGKLTQDEAVQHKASESTRTTWKEGNVEYRFAEGTSYDAAGTPLSVHRSLSKVVTTVLLDNELVEKSETTIVSHYLKFQRKDVDGIAKNVISKTIVREDHYDVSIAGQRTLVKSIENGVVSSKKSFEVETQLSPTVKVIKFVDETPREEVLGGGWKLVTTKSESSCTVESLN